jgi:hypothetical protein
MLKITLATVACNTTPSFQDVSEELAIRKAALLGGLLVHLLQLLK